MILLVGMAVGIDYSLFYLRREREERAAGREPRPALLRAAATSGQAVLISGVTVLIAMAGMFIASNRIFTSMAFGTMLVVSAPHRRLAHRPARALSKLGDRVDRGRIPYVGRKKHSAGESRFWGYVLDRVLRRPVLSILAGGLRCSPRHAAPRDAHEAPELHRHAEGAADRADLQARSTAFPGAPTPAEVVVQAPNVPRRRSPRRFRT